MFRGAATQFGYADEMGLSEQAMFGTLVSAADPFDDGFFDELVGLNPDARDESILSDSASISTIQRNPPILRSMEVVSRGSSLSGSGRSTKSSGKKDPSSQPASARATSTDEAVLKASLRTEAARAVQRDSRKIAASFATLNLGHAGVPEDADADLLRADAYGDDGDMGSDLDEDAGTGGKKSGKSKGAHQQRR